MLHNPNSTAPFSSSLACHLLLLCFFSIFINCNQFLRHLICIGRAASSMTSSKVGAYNPWRPYILWFRGSFAIFGYLSDCSSLIYLFNLISDSDYGDGFACNHIGNWRIHNCSSCRWLIEVRVAIRGPLAYSLLAPSSCLLHRFSVVYKYSPSGCVLLIVPLESRFLAAIRLLQFRLILGSQHGGAASLCL